MFAIEKSSSFSRKQLVCGNPFSAFALGFKRQRGVEEILPQTAYFVLIRKIFCCFHETVELPEATHLIIQ